MAATTSRTRSTPAPRDSVREPTRESGVALGRDGQPIRRVRANSDWSYIDPSMIPEGWVYQWKMYSCMGDEQTYVGYQADLHRAGWRHVPAERHDGVFLPRGATGAIRMRGQQLMERPIELELEARAEEQAKADAQVRMSKEQFGLATRFEGPDSNHPFARRTSGFNETRVPVDALGAPAPKYDVVID